MTSPHPGPIARRLRIARGITQQELAGIVGVTSGAIARVESGTGGWYRKTAAKILFELHQRYPLSPEEVTEFATAADLPEAMYADVLKTAAREGDPAEHSDTELVIDMLKELAAEHGADAIRAAIESLVVDHRRNATRRATPLTHRGQPGTADTVSSPVPAAASKTLPSEQTATTIRYVSKPRVVDLGEGVKAVEEVHTELSARHPPQPQADDEQPRRAADSV